MSDKKYTPDEPERKAFEEVFEKASQNNAEAQYKLGNCYFYGEGVEQNEEEAVKWYEKAALRGNAKAQDHLAYCYYKGQGVA